MVTLPSVAPASGIEFKTHSIKVWPPTLTSGFKSDEPVRNRSPRPAAKMPARRNPPEGFMRGPVKKPTGLREDRRACEDEDRQVTDRDNPATRRLPATPFSSRFASRAGHPDQRNPPPSSFLPHL